MDDQRIRAGRDHAAGQRIECYFRILIVDADPALDGDRNTHLALHGVDAPATSAGSAIRQAPKRPFFTRSDGQPTLRLISS